MNKLYWYESNTSSNSKTLGSAKFTLSTEESHMPTGFLRPHTARGLGLRVQGSYPHLPFTPQAVERVRKLCKECIMGSPALN